jgi:hypothetical protein
MSWGMRLSAGAVTLLCCLSLSVSTVVAAPLNDDFANREDLGVGFPVDVERSSFGATEEAGEPDLGGSGHSIWFSWKAADSGFVTADTCQNGIGLRPEIAVFTGTALGALTEVGGSFASEGPDCTSGGWGTAVTFKAIAGQVYAIGVDGVASFFGSEAGQGFIHLRLGATPTPANDDFADATVLNGEILPNGVYSASAGGFTWNATKEPEEPAHGGDPGGASVWYAWTAPSSGTYGLAGCGRFTSLLGVYTGDSLTTLNSVIGAAPCDGLVLLRAAAGTTYRIAVDGKLDAGSMTPAMGNVSVHLFLDPPSQPHTEGSAGMPEPPWRNLHPTETTIWKRLVNAERRSVIFRFRSSRRGSTFRCQLDMHGPTPCKSPKAYLHLSPGRHIFKVTAIDPAGGGDPTPAVARFRMADPRR